MKNASHLLEEFTASSFRDPKKAVEMFAADGAFEMPRLESIGIPWHYEAHDETKDSSSSSAISTRTWIFTM